MIRFVAKAFLPLAVLATSDIAVAESQPASITEPQSDAMKEAIRRGELIYLYDQTAWHTTDTMLEDIKDPAKAGVRGWVVLPTEAEFSFKAVYFGRDVEGLFEVYSAVWDGSAVSERRVSDQSAKMRLTDQANRLIGALDAAGEVEWKMCNKLSPNAVVLPRLNPDLPDSVYILTPQPDASSYLLGGHTRFDVKDGKIVQQRRFANSCLTMNKKDNRKAGEELTSFVATHLLDEVPTEIHVFTMLASHVPMMVATTQNNLLWSLGREDGEVVFDVDRMSPSDHDK